MATLTDKQVFDLLKGTAKKGISNSPIVKGFANDIKNASNNKGYWDWSSIIPTWVQPTNGSNIMNYPSTKNETKTPYDYSSLTKIGYNGGESEATKGARNAYNMALSGTSPVDLTNVLNSIRQGGEARKATAQYTYDTKRQDLLTSIKRFQENNQLQQDQQRQDFLNLRADLEDARYQADRANRIDAASRGIGGSGLQQLSQLQTLLSQGKQISQAARSNQTIMDKLRTELQQAREDSDRGLANALKEYDLSVQGTDADVATQIAQAIYNEEVRQRQAQANAASLLANLQASESADNEYANSIEAIVRNAYDRFNQIAGSNAKKDKYDEIYDTAMQKVTDSQESLGFSPAISEAAQENLRRLMDYYSKGKTYK